MKLSRGHNTYRLLLRNMVVWNSLDVSEKFIM